QQPDPTLPAIEGFSMKPSFSTPDLKKKERNNATRHDRTWTDGRQHGAAPNQKRPPMRGLRPVGIDCERSSEGKGGWRVVAGRFSKETTKAARRLADGPGCGCRQKHRRPRAVARSRRHSHRWRQFVLRG